VLERLHESRSVDLAPAEVYATLLDKGRHLCSERTMYRLLAAHDEVWERRNLSMIVGKCGILVCVEKLA
jgi:putative transposase